MLGGVLAGVFDASTLIRLAAIALRHSDGRPAPATVFVGRQSLLDSLLQVLREPGLVCEVTILPLLSPHGDRRELARRASAAVGTATGVHHPVPRGRHPVTPAAA